MLDRGPLVIAIAAGLGGMIGRLAFNGPWPANAGDWVGVLALGVLTALGVYVVLRYLARRRQP